MNAILPVSREEFAAEMEALRARTLAEFSREPTWGEVYDHVDGMACRAVIVSLAPPTVTDLALVASKLTESLDGLAAVPPKPGGWDTAWGFIPEED